MKLICCIQDEIQLLPHFVKYYKSIGVTKFIFGIREGDKNPVWSIVKNYDPLIEVFISYDDKNFDFYKEHEFMCRIKEFCNPNEWFIPADLDEFHQLPGFQNVIEMQNSADIEHADYIWGRLVDRITKNGSIPEFINSNISIWEQFPECTYLTKYLVKGCDAKIMMMKTEKTFDVGHHKCLNGREFSEHSFTHHFKWCGNFMDKVTSRLLDNKNNNCNWGIYEYSNLQNELIKNNGSLPLCYSYDKTLLSIINISN